jgi:hypothetical protein
METINLLATDNFKNESKPSALNILACKCPRCRLGDMFKEKNPYHLKKTMSMNENCPVCGQPFDIEVGFYYGSSYASYALSIAISVATLVAWWFLIGFNISDNRIFYWLAFNALLLVALQPVLMRQARSIWLAIFIRYDRNWRNNPAQKPERVNELEKNNW